MMKSNQTTKPYAWVPSLYLGEALPFSAVMLISVILFRLQGTLAIFMIIAFASATHDISADGFYIIGLPDKEQELYVGVRNTFYRIGMVIGQGGLVLLAGYMQDGHFGETMQSVSASWMTVFIILGILMFLLGLYHAFILPKVETSVHDRFDFKEQMHEFVQTLKVFLTKPHLISAICFILLFRLPEGLLTKIVPLFLKRTTDEGGLAMSDVDFGLIYGTLGVIGLLLGGIIGGWAVSKWGLKKCLWPLVLCITLPDIVYVYLSYFPTDNLWLIGSCVCIEQIGYGLGFAAYTLYLVTFSRGERSTAVFSICTAGQYLGGVMIPGIVSGFISGNIGYQNFFWVVMAFCLVTFAVTACVKIEDHKD